MKRWMMIAGVVLLAACAGEGTTVYNHLGNALGSVRVDDKNHAIVFNDDGETIGIIQGNTVHTQQGRAGNIMKGKIYDSQRKEVGTMGDGTDCYNESGKRVGRLSSVIDLEAAGGACLLLLLQ